MNAHVGAHDEHGAGGVIDPRQRSHRNHLALGVAHLELLDLLGIGTKLRGGLHVDLPSAAKGIEVVDVLSAHVDLERGEHVRDRHLQRLDLGAVDVHV